LISVLDREGESSFGQRDCIQWGKNQKNLPQSHLRLQCIIRNKKTQLKLKHMKTTSIALGIALFATPLFAGVETKASVDKKVIVPVETESRLSISAGVLSREIKADFYTDPTASTFGATKSDVTNFDREFGTDLLGTARTHGADQNTRLAPYLKADFRVLGGDENSFNVFGQYSFVPDSDHTSGNVARTLTDRRPETSSAKARAFGLSTLTRSNLDLSMHELALGFEYQRKVCERVHVTVAAGPTFNLFDYDYDSTTKLIAGQRVVKKSRTSNDDQAFRIGAVGQVGVKVDLDSKKRTFVELFGRYNWVDGLTVGAKNAHVSVDANSFSGGIGFGVNL